MNASEWSYAGLQSLLDYLKGQATERKLRLFAAACARRLWPLLEERVRQGVELAERVADGEVPADRLAAGLRAARSGMIAARKQLKAKAERDAAGCAYTTVHWAMRKQMTTADALRAAQAAEWAAGHVAKAAAARNDRTAEPQAQALARAAHAEMIHCLFGNPFRPVAVDTRRWLQLPRRPAPRNVAFPPAVRQFELPRHLLAVAQPHDGERRVRVVQVKRVLRVGERSDRLPADSAEYVALAQAELRRGRLRRDPRHDVAAIHFQREADVLRRRVNPQLVEAPLAARLERVALQLVDLMAVDARGRPQALEAGVVGGGAPGGLRRARRTVVALAVRFPGGFHRVAEPAE
jgi:hypothetical protein